MIRLGLCCTFLNEPIKFQTTTAAFLSRRPRADGLTKLGQLARANADALLAALAFCSTNGIGAFRINSGILPLKTHPQHGYDVSELPEGAATIERFRACGRFAAEHNLRTSFHPDQFVVLNSARPEVVDSSIAEIEYQAEIAEWVGADVINVHGGGAFGDKPAALAAFVKSLGRLSPRARQRLTVENDDKVYTPADLLPLCRAQGLPLVYDVHHHRCHADGMTVEAATAAALATWAREPLFHVSSPIDGWGGPKPERHHDFIDPADVPTAWDALTLTLDVEAKAKEVAVLRLKADLARRTRESV
ncbi:MAG TPA: UV DNA damage repair endonuclease UvsE [Gemmataceae bacterium]|nr:UV DNA damage repair endonuclease UvsE [Gemmataceae bacterium]